MGAVGLYTHIQANNFRSALLLIGFPILLLVMVFFLTVAGIGAGYLPPPQEGGSILGEAAGFMLAAAPGALIVSLIWFAIAYFANQAIIDAATGAHQVTRQDEPELYNLLENLCISRGLKTPTLRIIESDGMNAFATGLNDSQYSITVTRGLMRAMSKDELEAVLGHELTHVLNRDVRTMVIASVFAGIISLMAQIIYRAIMWGGVGSRRDDKRSGGGVWVFVALAVAAVGYVLAIVIQMTLSRSREFVADAGSVELTKNPDAMISALQKISGHAHLDAPESVRSMFLEDESAGVMGLFATHPPISKRIEALVKFAGGRVSELPEPSPVAPADGPWSDPPASPPAAGPWG